MNTIEVYRYVIEDVISNLKKILINEIDEENLNKLKKIWENKLTETGIFSDSDSILSNSLSNPYILKQEEDDNIINTEQNSILTLNSSSNINRPIFNITSSSNSGINLNGKPSPYMPPLSWELNPTNFKVKNLTPSTTQINITPPNPFLVTTLNISIPKITNNDYNNNFSLSLKKNISLEKSLVENELKKRKKIRNSSIIQLDGKNDNDIEVNINDMNKEIESNIDTEIDLNIEEEKEPETQNIILCQFEKINRIKNKRKFFLKDGIVHINKKDYLFNKCTAETEF